MCRQAIVPPNTPTLLKTIGNCGRRHCVSRSSVSSTEFRAFCAFIVLLVVLSLQPSIAFANCAADNPVGGTTTCSGDPTTFPNGGASAQGGNTTLDVNGLTGNIIPTGGTAGAIVSITPGQASGGTSLPIHGTNGCGGSDSPDVTVNFIGTGSGFQVNTNNADWHCRAELRSGGRWRRRWFRGACGRLSAAGRIRRSRWQRYGYYDGQRNGPDQRDEPAWHYRTKCRRCGRQRWQR